jgi:hypothetical protein
MMDPTTRGILGAAADSLRDVHSLRDFLSAVHVGSQTAIGMLDDVERSLMRILRTVDRDSVP